MKYLFSILSSLIVVFGQTQAADKPNVIFILADDFGIGNVGCYGSDHYKTPQLDKLAAEGTRFTQCFTAALCGPSRAMIMTGRYAFRNGSSNQDACMVMPNKELQLARVFKSAGYDTSFIGKWGQLPGDPDEAGFDDYLRFNGSAFSKPVRTSLSSSTTPWCMCMATSSPRPTAQRTARTSLATTSSTWTNSSASSSPNSRR
jgi:arylsulfatase A-like enzyme